MSPRLRSVPEWLLPSWYRHPRGRSLWHIDENRRSRSLDGVLVRRLLVLVAVLIILTIVAGSIAPVPTTFGPPAQPEATGAPPRLAVRTVRASLSTSPRRPARPIDARLGDR